MQKGGIIGFYCTHAYAHATKSAIKYLPWCLKGLDMTVYETFKALPCHVILRPVFLPSLSDLEDEDYDIDLENIDDDSEDDPEDEYRWQRKCAQKRQLADDRREQKIQLEMSKTYIGKEMFPIQFLDDGLGDDWNDRTVSTQATSARAGYVRL